LTFYDAVGQGGGAGISSKAFDFIDLLLQQAVERVDSCSCNDGCPECDIPAVVNFDKPGINSTVCSEGNIVTSKLGATVILKSLLDLDIDLEALPFGDERGYQMETIVTVQEGSVPEADQVRRF
jgi:DEAD/DEAH box helicase domain-containing protein